MQGMDKREEEDGGKEGGREGERALGGPWGFTEAEFDEPFTPYLQTCFNYIFSYFLTLGKFVKLYL